MDSLVNEATNQAWKFGAKALDKWTKSRDAKKQQVDITSTEIPESGLPNAHPETQETSVQQTATQQKPDGDAAGIEATVFMSTKYPELAALPMFPLSDEKEHASRAKALQRSALHRSHIKEMNFNLGEKVLLHLSGASAIQTVNKLENGLHRLNAQSGERAADQRNRILLTRWTLSPSGDEFAEVRPPPLLVDLVEVQVQAFSEKLKGTLLYIRANMDVHVNIDGQFDAQIVVNASWHKRLRGYHDVKQLQFVHPSGQMYEMEVVRIQRRWCSRAELEAREKVFKKVGLEARFDQWVVPSLASWPDAHAA